MSNDQRGSAKKSVPVTSSPDKGKAGPTPAAAPPKPGKPAKPATVKQPDAAMKFTRIAAAWWALIIGLVLLVILLMFVAQNTESIMIKFLGWQWTAPLGVAFLLAAVGGAMITVMAGGARMIQLHRAAKKNLRTAAQTGGASGARP